MNIQEIIYKECLSDTETYLYEEGGKWFAYYHSASKIDKPEFSDCVLAKELFMLYGLEIRKIRVDLQGLLNKKWRVELCADDQITLA